MIIGKFTKNGQNFAGSIRSFGANFPEVTFEAIRSNGNGPDYALTSGGCDLGIAWKKTSNEGTDYVSVLFKGPFLKDPIWTALFQVKNQDDHVLVWNEPRDAR
jgi:uncharacterized protein (DUF736 family)